MIFVVIVFIFSCKVSSLPMNAIGRYVNDDYTLTINQDNSFSYVERAGCFWGTWKGSWEQLNDRSILLVFSENKDILDYLGSDPFLGGQKLQAEILSNTAIKLKNAVLTKMTIRIR